MKRPSRYLRIADQVGHRLELILPPLVCSMAVASCKFVIQGPRSVGTASSKNWGQWVRTQFQAGGHKPAIGIWQGERSISGDAHANADVILGLFGISIFDVLDHYGQPAKGVKYDVDLVDVIEALAPELLTAFPETSEVAAVA